MTSSSLTLLRRFFSTGSSTRKARRLNGDVSARFESGHVWRGAVRVVDAAKPRTGELILERFSADELQRAASAFSPNEVAYEDSFATAEHVKLTAPLSGAETEIAIMGRSNCGKSTLLNAVLGRQVAQVSQRPGFTRTANRFRVAQLFTMIDVPGYGFADAPRELRKQWGQMESAFFEHRQSVALFLLLVDSRRGLTDLDRERIERLERHARTYQLILTKADKLSSSELRRCVAECEERVRDKVHRFALPSVVATSGLVNNYGIDVLRAALLESAGLAARIRSAPAAAETLIEGLAEHELHEKIAQPKQRPGRPPVAKEELLQRHVLGDPLAVLQE